MNQFYLQLVSVLLGGAIAISGSVLGHIFATSRDSKSRKIQGLHAVATELSNLVRLNLDAVQLRNSVSPEEFQQNAFHIVGWKEMTLKLQARTYRFPCMAYLPEALPYFDELSQIIFDEMCFQGVYTLTDGQQSEQDRLAKQHHAVVATIETQIQLALAKVL